MQNSQRGGWGSLDSDPSKIRAIKFYFGLYHNKVSEIMSKRYHKKCLERAKRNRELKYRKFTWNGKFDISIGGIKICEPIDSIEFKIKVNC